MTLEQELQEARVELESARMTASTLQADIANHNRELKVWEEQLKQLVGGWGKTGTIPKLTDKVEKLKLKIAHSKMPKVVWKGEPAHYLRDAVVHKVTPKRIFVGNLGADRPTQFEKTGKAVGYCAGEIDIEATFGGPCPEKMK